MRLCINGKQRSYRRINIGIALLATTNCFISYLEMETTGGYQVDGCFRQISKNLRHRLCFDLA